MELTKEKVIEPAPQPNMKLGKTIFFTFLKTILTLIVISFWLISVITCLAPKTAARLYDRIGASASSAVCYERVYKKSKNSVDLYNLSERLLKSRSYKKAADYIKELQEKDDYAAFCKKVNDAAILKSQVKYVAYVADIDGYLVAQRTTALYRSKQPYEAKSVALADLDNTNMFSFALSSYVSLVTSDSNKTDDEVKAELSEFVKEPVFDKITERISTLSGEPTSTVNHIIRTYTLLKIQNTLYTIYSNTNDQAGVANSKAEIEKLRNTYNQLIQN